MLSVALVEKVEGEASAFQVPPASRSKGSRSMLRLKNAAHLSSLRDLRRSTGTGGTPSYLGSQHQAAVDALATFWTSHHVLP